MGMTLEDIKEYKRNAVEILRKNTQYATAKATEIAFDSLLAWIKNQPIADVEKVKHGHWIYNTDDFSPKMRCSVCGYNKPLVAGEGIEQKPDNYCNRCGAKMDEREDKQNDNH